MLVGIFGQVELIEVEDVGVIDGLCLQRVRLGTRNESKCDGEQGMTKE